MDQTTFDPSMLTVITPNRRKSEDFDLRFSAKTKKFRFSSDTFTMMGLADNGITLFQAPQGMIVLSVQSEETSQLLKKRRGNDNKGREFTSSELVRLLKLNKVTEDHDLSVTEISSTADATYYSLVVTGKSASLDMSGFQTEATPKAAAPAPVKQAPAPTSAAPKVAAPATKAPEMATGPGPAPAPVAAAAQPAPAPEEELSFLADEAPMDFSGDEEPSEELVFDDVVEGMTQEEVAEEMGASFDDAPFDLVEETPAEEAPSDDDVLSNDVFSKPQPVFNKKPSETLVDEDPLGFLSGN